MDLIVAIVDRSGSMYSIKGDAEGGLNTFLEKQKAEGEARLTLAEFDNQYDLVHDDIVLEDFNGYELEPRGGTALYDAIGRTIIRVKDYAVDGVKFLVIVTDGGENASQEFQSKTDIMKMISDMRDDGWETIFIGADEASMEEARGLGIDMRTAFVAQKSGQGAQDMYSAVGAYATSMRGGNSKGASVRSLNATITSSTTLHKSASQLAEEAEDDGTIDIALSADGLLDLDDAARQLVDKDSTETI
jgi:hypothetical protein